ncbi:MAG TPA: DUF5132 domain-containing protein [Oculatellaceae cyanobacterium]
MGPWGIAAIALIGATTTDGGRKLLRAAAKNVIKAGIIAKEKGSAAIGEVKEQLADVVAEVKAEVHAEAAEASNNGDKKTAKASAKASASDDA